MTSNSKRHRSRLGVRLPLWAIGILAVIILALVFGSGIWLFRTVQAEVSQLEMSEPDFSGVVEPVPGTAVPGASQESELNNSETILPASSLEAWSGTERISFLLLGIDRRCDEDGPTHTDSMMILTVDPVSQSAALLSLPRDLWVEIPGFGVDRINQAYYFGEAYEYPGGGQALARETVEATIGIPIDYYLAVDFEAFTEGVNLIGGIEIDVPETIDDPTYPDNCYGFDPFYMEAGEQQMDGETALKYARTRATFGGDVDRAGRQQAVILAVRQKVTSLDMAPQLIAEAPRMWQTLQDNIRTNLTLDEAVQLALLAREIPRDNIRSAVIDYDYVYNETTPDGRQVLVPVRDKIRELRDELFAPSPAPTPVVENLPDLMREEEARVAIFNGTSVFGLAGETQQYLQQFDVNVTEVGNADAATYRTTQVIDYGDHPATTRYLVQLMGVPPLNVSSATRPDGEYDVLVIIGDDWRVPGQ